MPHKRIALLGTPRSGTRYAHWVLRAAGLDVEHERMGPDGTVSGLFAFPHHWVPGGHGGQAEELPQDYAFDQRWALVRDPLRTIPSLVQTLEHGNIARYYREVGVPMDGPPMARALQVWVATYLSLNHQGFSILRVEDLPSRWPEIAERFGLRRRMPDPGPQSWRHHLQPVSWLTLYHLDEQMADMALRLAVSVGYRYNQRETIDLE